MGESFIWSKVEEFLGPYKSRLRVAKTMVELGLRISEDGRVFCGPIEIPATKIARACSVDRRVVKETTGQILKNKELREIFLKIQPAGPSFRDVARHLGFGVVEVTADPKTVGIVAGVASLISEQGISIRQILADDPELYPNPKLTVITERPVPGEMISEFLKIPGVQRISIY